MLTHPEIYMLLCIVIACAYLFYQTFDRITELEKQHANMESHLALVSKEVVRMRKFN